MTVSFDCANCGKSFEVHASLAGKRGRCKQCGNINRIPFPNNQAGPAAPVDDPYGFEDRPSNRREPTSTRRVSSTHQSGPLDEELRLAPLPRLTRRPLEDSELPVPSRPKEKTNVGFFAKAPKSRTSTSVGQKSAWGTTFGVIVAIAIFLARFAINQGYIGGFGLSSRSELEQDCETMVRESENCVSALKTIHDEASAQTAAPRVVASLQRIADVLRNAKDKKAKRTTIEAIKAKYGARLVATGQSLEIEFMRVGAIPGVRDALQGIAGPATEIQQITQTLPSGVGGSPLPLASPRFLPPPSMPPPSAMSGGVPSPSPRGGFSPGGSSPTHEFGGRPPRRFGPRLRSSRLGPPS
jgi:hypothetical protein